LPGSARGNISGGGAGTRAMALTLRAAPLPRAARAAAPSRSRAAAAALRAAPRLRAWLPRQQPPPRTAPLALLLRISISYAKKAAKKRHG